MSGYRKINRITYKIAKTVFSLLYNIATRRHVSGLENLPPGGPLIIVSNHMSITDPLLVFIQIPYVAHALVAEKYEQHPFSLVLNMGGPIYINRGEVDRKALNQMFNLLKDGGVVAIAAEGTRSKTGQLTQAKRGVAYIVAKSNVPVLPVAVYGTEDVFGNMKRLRRTDVYTAFGKPLHFESGPIRSLPLDEHTDRIMVALAAMMPERYRGYYADHPLLEEYLNEQST